MEPEFDLHCCDSVNTFSVCVVQLEHASMKEHLQNSLKDNQVLKRAVAIQHDRNLEQEEKAREVQQLKDVIRQYQEQIRALEVTNLVILCFICHLYFLSIL